MGREAHVSEVIIRREDYQGFKADAGLVRCDHRKVAIIGAGGRRVHAPWDDDTWCWWALNEIGQPRFDRHFELHPMAVQSDKDFAALRAMPAPCYVLDLADAERHGVANAVAYPLARILEATGGRRYFTCTFAYQIALAVADGFAEISLWGVDLDLGTARERLVEKPCVEYWLGLAEGRGVKVTLPLQSTLLDRRYLYGYDYDGEKADIERIVEEFPTNPRDVCPACHDAMADGKVDSLVSQIANLTPTEAHILETRLFNLR